MKTLARRNPSIFSTFPSFFDDFFINDFASNAKQLNSTAPEVNVIESEESFKLEVLVPGFKKENIKINVEDDVLTISSELSEEKETTDNGKLTRREFSFSSFKRSFSLPEIVDIDSIDAVYENGVLNVTLPKKKEVVTQKVKTVEIQ